MPTLTVHLPADRAASVLREKLDAIEDANTIRELTLNNCILADTEELRECISRCVNLRILTCLSVPFKPNDLVQLVLGPLQQLTRLEFSLLVNDDDVAAEVEAVEAVKMGLQQESARNLHHMYVEVASERNFSVLSALLPVCPKLSHLHVHVLRGQLEPAIMKCADILHKHEHITLFMMSSEVPSISECEPPPALDMGSCAKVCGNVMQKRPPSSWNCLRLHDLAAAQDQEGVHQIDTVTVVAVHRTATPAQFTVAGERNRWEHVRHLCVVLFPAHNSARYPTAESAYNGPLRSFFSHFRSLVELNVNSFHCHHNLDMTWVLATTRFESMRSLSIAPCAIQSAGAVSRLAAICPKLEDLDIRFRCAGRYTHCHRCQGTFTLNPQEMAHLQTETQLMRITLAYVPGVAAYTFLNSVRVAEVRLIHSPSSINQGYVGLGTLLAVNEKLRCLVLADDNLEFGMSWMQGNLFPADKLRYLVMISKTTVSDPAAVLYCHQLAQGFPRMEAMHVHYKNSVGDERRMTWIRRPEAPEELQGEPEQPGQPRGWLLHNKPCVMCSTETFIGLVKPHNRGTRTCF